MQVHTMQTHGKIKKQAVQSIFHCLAPLVFILDFSDKFSFHALLRMLVQTEAYIPSTSSHFSSMTGIPSSLFCLIFNSSSSPG